MSIITTVRKISLIFEKQFELFLYNNIKMFQARTYSNRCQFYNEALSTHYGQTNMPNLIDPRDILANQSSQEREELLKRTTFNDSSNSFQQQQSSEVSFGDNIMEQHLACLKHLISKIIDMVVEASNLTDELPKLDFDWQREEYTLLDYLSSGKSLIPADQLIFLSEYLEKDDELYDTLSYIYGHASPHLGDELILATHRILLAYLPIKYLQVSAQDIYSISEFSWNIINIFRHPSFSFLRIVVDERLNVSPMKLRGELLTYLKRFVQTILLILEKYFHNPQYENIEDYQKESPAQQSSIVEN